MNQAEETRQIHKVNRPLPVGAVLILALGLSFMAGCATAYQANAFSGGYKDFRLEDNTFQVSFYGNAYTSRETVELYHLYRCAEVTIEAGGDYFVVDDRGADTNFSVQKYGKIVSAETRYSKTSRIRIFKGTKPKNNPNAYDARAVLKNLGPRIER